MTKLSGEADALLMRIETLKWQAVAVLGSSRRGLEREEAAALIASLDGIALAVRSDPAPETIRSAEERVDRLVTLRGQPPQRRAAGRS